MEATSTDKARVFKFGRRQYVRLPFWLRVKGKEVSVRRVDSTVILEPVEIDIEAIFARIDRIGGTFPEREPQPPMQERDFDFD